MRRRDTNLLLLVDAKFATIKKIPAFSGWDPHTIKKDPYPDGKGLANNRYIANKAGAEPVMTTLLYSYSPLEPYSAFDESYDIRISAACQSLSKCRTNFRLAVDKLRKIPFPAGFSVFKEKQYNVSR